MVGFDGLIGEARRGEAKREERRVLCVSVSFHCIAVCVWHSCSCNLTDLSLIIQQHNTALPTLLRVRHVCHSILLCLD